MISVYNESRSAHWLVAIGDSHTQYPSGYVRASQTWVPNLVNRLRTRGYNVRGRAFGIGGETSAMNLARADVMFVKETPDIGLIYIGVNDPGASITQAQTQANIQALIKVLKHRVLDNEQGPTNNGSNVFSGSLTVAAPSNLPAGRRPGARVIVMADNDTTGGIATPTWPGAAATITGTVAGSGQSVWECDNELAGVNGWHRVAVSSTPATYCKKIVVVSAPYLNFTSGGDTPSTPNASNTPVRTAQQAAVTAENVAIGGQPSVIYADLYTMSRTRIVGGTWPSSGTVQYTWAAGTDPDFSTVSYDQTRSWHGQQNDQHKNAYGHQLTALAVETAIINAGWTSSLRQLKNTTPVPAISR